MILRVTKCPFESWFLRCGWTSTGRCPGGSRPRYDFRNFHPRLHWRLLSVNGCVDIVRVRGGRGLSTSGAAKDSTALEDQVEMNMKHSYGGGGILVKVICLGIV